MQEYCQLDTKGTNEKSFRGISLLRIEATFLIVWYDWRLTTDEGSASVIRGRYLVFNIR